MPVPVAFVETVVLYVVATATILLEDGVDDVACVPNWLLTASSGPKHFDALTDRNVNSGDGLERCARERHGALKLQRCFAERLRLGICGRDGGREAGAYESEFV